MAKAKPFFAGIFYILLCLIAGILLFNLVLSACAKHVEGTGSSISVGAVNNGHLKNGRRFPYSGENYKYFSSLSYLLFNRAWVHQDVLDCSLEAYQTCQQTCPDTRFLLMECSEKDGGRLWPHRTHQKGTSIDFGTPLIKNGDPWHFHNHYGLWHYAMAFDQRGRSKLNPSVQIDFETMGRHILALDDAARKRNMYLKKVIFKIDLKDDLYATVSGQEVKRRGIYFARNLPARIDKLHDDHYHIDFAWR